MKVRTVSDAPTGLVAAPGDARVTLTWTAPTGAETYNVYRSLSPDDPNLPELQLTPCAIRLLPIFSKEGRISA